MHWLLIVGVSLAAVVALVAVSVAILIYRFNRWADAMIFSIGIPELWPPEPAETPGTLKSEPAETPGTLKSDPCGNETRSIHLRSVRWDLPQEINPVFRRLPTTETRIHPQK
jgi:hypothetical protein